MSESYYKPCRELDICNELIEKYFNTEQYEKCFEGHLVLAEQGYPLAECQVGYFYYEGLGVKTDLEQALYWTKRAAEHGDRDGQCNLAWFYEDAIGVAKDMEKAKYWYKQAALQNHDLAIEKCKELNVSITESQDGFYYSAGFGKRYAETHSAINPLTADYATFVSDLPDCVFYQKEDDMVSCFAFGEGNEIAYVYGRNEGIFVPFAEILVGRLLSEFQTICFEADGCDWMAMKLKALFRDQSEASFNTYVYDGRIS